MPVQHLLRSRDVPAAQAHLVQFRKHVTLVAAMLAVGACSEPIQPNERPVPPGAAALAADTQPVFREGTAPFLTVRRIDLDVDATGPFEPGKPIVIQARASANRAASETNIDVLSIDGESAALRGADAHPQILAREAGAMSRGSERTVMSSVTFPKPGYYRVVVHAVGRPGSAERSVQEQDTVVLNASSETLWIVVDAKGGRLTDGFDSTVVGGAEKPQFGSYGPFVESNGGTTTGAATASKASIAAMDLDGTGYHYDGEVRYHDYDLNAYRSVPDARIDAVCHSASSSVSVSTRTAQDGTFSIDCPSGYNTVSGNIYLANTYANVVGAAITCTPLCLYAAAGGSFSGSFGQYLLLSVSNNFAARAYKTLTTYVPRAFTRFGRTRGAVLVSVSETDPGYGSEYSSSYDRIRTNYTDLDGEDGRFLIMHEYGHAFQWVAIDHWYSYDCGSGHSLGGINTGSCAYVEGFADFFSVWLAGDSITGPATARFTDYEAETRLFHGDSDGDPDGANIEGAVAAFMYDLVDGPSDPDGASNETGTDDDTFTGSAADLAYIMRYCTLTIFFGSRDKLDGVDQLVYCSENSLAAQSAYPQYFHLCTEVFLSVNAVRPASWTQSVIRALWLNDLYDAP